MNRQRDSEAPRPSPEALLREARFQDVRVRTLSRTIRFEDGEPFLRLNAMAFLGMSAAARTMDDQQRRRIMDAIVSESAPVSRSYTDGTGLAFGLSTNLATARG